MSERSKFCDCEYAGNPRAELLTGGHLSENRYLGYAREPDAQAAGALDKSKCGKCRAAAGEYVIDDQYTIVDDDRILVHLQLPSRVVDHVVALGKGGPRQLSSSPREDGPSAEKVRKRRTEAIAERLDAYDAVDGALELRGECVHDLPE